MKLCGRVVLLLVVFFFVSFVSSVSALNATEEIGHGESGATGEDHAATEEHAKEGSECEDEEHQFDSQVRLARVEFERVETIFVVLVFIMVVVLAKMCKLNRVVILINILV